MLNEYEKKPEQGGSCPAVGYQNIDVCVPVTVKPFAHTGTPKTQCLGIPVIHEGGCDCDEKKKECKFSISQRIRVEIPVVFGAKAEVGEASIDCDCAGGEKA